MRILFSSVEIEAGISLTSAIIGHLPKAIRKDIRDKLFDMEHDFKAIVNADIEYAGDRISDFNSKYGRDFGQAMRIFLTHEERELMIDIDSVMIADIATIVESEVNSIAGTMIMAYGLAMTLGTTMMRMFERIKERVKRD